MVGLERLARRHPIAVFYGATLAFSWTLWGLMIASARGVLPFPFVTNWTGSFGPAFGAVLVTAATEGRAGVNELLRRAGRWRFGGRLWALIAVGSLVPFFAGVGAYAAVRGPGGGVLDVV